MISNQTVFVLVERLIMDRRPPSTPDRVLSLCHHSSIVAAIVRQLRLRGSLDARRLDFLDDRRSRDLLQARVLNAGYFHGISGIEVADCALLAVRSQDARVLAQVQDERRVPELDGERPILLADISDQSFLVTERAEI